jgi:type IV secretory pathway VirD2 relaxase
MKGAVVQLYVHIINFLLRAKSWYEENRFRRIVNAIARPTELRYDDIVQDIENCTMEIDHLSTAGARAEQRDMHLKLQELSQNQQKMEALITDVRKLCIGKCVTYSANEEGD